MTRSDRAGDRSENRPDHGHRISDGRAGDHAVLSGSRIVTSSQAITERLATWIRSSALYGWLTAEPDPDVIVIDLRETRTVGPVIRIIDRVFAALAASTPSSRVARGGRSLITMFKTRPLKLFGAVILVGALGGLLGGALTGTLSVPQAIVLFILALLAIPGIRSEIPLTELRETALITTLADAFEPPEPPATNRSTDQRNETDDQNNSDTPDS